MRDQDFSLMSRPLSRFFDEKDERAAIRRAFARGWRHHYYQLREGVFSAACFIESTPYFLASVFRSIRACF